MKSSWQFVILLASAAVQAALIDSACKPIPGDSNWPSDSVWTEELPGTVKSPPQQGNTTRPDFVFTAKGPADVQAAIRFVGKHNVRLSIINSGHDFLGRYVILISIPRAGADIKQKRCSKRTLAGGGESERRPSR
jgi:hypothetical protein